jgi:hypothetical protein
VGCCNFVAAWAHAVQVVEDVSRLVKDCHLKVVGLAGGEPVADQVRRLRALTLLCTYNHL